MALPTRSAAWTPGFANEPALCGPECCRPLPICFEVAKSSSPKTPYSEPNSWCWTGTSPDPGSSRSTGGLADGKSGHHRYGTSIACPARAVSAALPGQRVPALDSEASPCRYLLNNRANGHRSLIDICARRICSRPNASALGRQVYRRHKIRRDRVQP